MIPKLARTRGDHPRYNGSKSDLKISSFQIFELDPQIIYHSIELEKLSNLCEDTSEKFSSLRAPDKKNPKLYFTFGNFYLENFWKPIHFVYHSKAVTELTIMQKIA